MYLKRIKELEEGLADGASQKDHTHPVQSVRKIREALQYESLSHHSFSLAYTNSFYFGML